MATTVTERSLLFGILAAELRSVSRGDLMEALNAWLLEQGKPLGELLVVRGAMQAEQRELVERLVDEELKLHSSAVEMVSGVGSPSAIAESNTPRVDEPDVEMSLMSAQQSCAAEQPSSLFAINPIQLRPIGDRSTRAVRPTGSRFQILRRHAEGGLGAVSVALDTELNREVALKQIRRSVADRADYRARFVLEAEITGALEHPGIVPVYSLGYDAGGQPFYAMRFIRGDSLADAIAAFHKRWPSQHSPGDDRTPGERMASASRELELRSLLRRFIDVCNAIGYAHSRGVLHRDLKPRNIMLGKFGETLVVDWGLAKAAGQGDADAALDVDTAIRPASASGTPDTMPGSAIGTPQFMSPEQAAGRLELLGARSDVYALGATLYAILTGHAPVEGSDVREVLDKVQRGEIAPPLVYDSAVARALEAICQKAMAMQPEDRYDSAGALAEDIERWLADEPVRAYHDSRLERSRRWARKHRTLTTSATAAVLVALFGSFAFATTLSAKNRALIVERARALDREQLAVDAVTRYGDVVRETPELKNEPRLASLRTALLKEPQTFFKRLRERLHADRETTPESLARLAAASYNLGRLTDEIGDRQDALRDHEEALAIRLRLAHANPSNTEFQSDLADSYDAVGIVQNAMGRPALARVAYEQARGIRERLAEENPAETQFRLDLAATLIYIGNMELADGRREESLASHTQAATINERLARENPSVVPFQAALAKSLYQVGMMQSSTGRTVEARASFDEALKIRERLARENPKVTTYQTDLAASLNIAGNWVKGDGRLPEALQCYLRARTIQERLVRENPSVTQFQASLAISAHNIGETQCWLDHPAEAREAYDQARMIWERLVREHPESPSFAGGLGETLVGLVEIDLDQERFDQARETLKQAIATDRKALAANPDHPWYRHFLDLSLGDTIRAAEALGRDEEAAQARRELDELRASDPWNLAADARLKAVLSGEQLKDDSERLRFATQAYLKGLYAASARFLAETLARNSKPADGSPDPNRYSAACSAALAGCGFGSDAPAEPERTKLRTQSRAWLEADLDAWERLLEKPAQDSARASVVKTLNRWRRDPDLSGVRYPSAMARLPEPERAKWTALWRRVDAALTRAKAATPPAAP
jgi:serine/threonine-protein kinase